jgi:protein SCO1/2
VTAVNITDRTVTVSHDAIPSYMEAMTMPFNLKDPSLIKDIQPGDDLSADLVVGAKASWLDNVVMSRSITDESSAAVSKPPEGPREGESVPDFKLINQDGRAIHMAEFRGKVVALTFVYTRCPLPDYCILMNENFASVAKSLETDPKLQAETRLLTVSFDTKRDTPSVLRTFGLQKQAGLSSKPFQFWQFATASPEDMTALTKFFGVAVDDSNGQITHSLLTAVIDKNGKIATLLPSNRWTPDDLLSALRTAGESKG